MCGSGIILAAKDEDAGKGRQEKAAESQRRDTLNLMKRGRVKSERRLP